MRTNQTRRLKDSISQPTTLSVLGVLGWLWLTLLPVREAGGQGTVIFGNMVPGGPGVGITLHVWGTSTNNYPLALVGLGSNDSPSGTTPFAESGMSLIGASGSGGHFGSATTFAQLLGAVGADQPPYTLAPVGQTTTFRSGSTAGRLTSITDTLRGIPKDAAAATFAIVAWDNSSGDYPTWTEASVAWQRGIIAAGYSAPFTVTNIGGDSNVPPYLNNNQGTNNGMTSFNLFYCLSLVPPWGVNTLPATTVTANSATLNGSVCTICCPVTGWFEWGTTTNYGYSSPATQTSKDCIPFSASLTGLTPGTTYHFRAAAANIWGPAGPSWDQSFTTRMPVVTNTGSGYWDAASSTLSYRAASSGDSQDSFILLQSADLTAPLSAWTRVATNASLPGSFPIPPVGRGAAIYYRIKSE